jgi:hypothetical protein
MKNARFIIYTCGHKDCTFAVRRGESALKEAETLCAKLKFFPAISYVACQEFFLILSSMDELTRAELWYADDGTIPTVLGASRLFGNACVFFFRCKINIAVNLAGNAMAFLWKRLTSIRYIFFLTVKTLTENAGCRENILFIIRKTLKSRRVCWTQKTILAQ